MNTLLRPGDDVIVTVPGYQSLYAVRGGAGLHGDPLAAGGERGAVEPRSELPEQPLRPATGLLMVISRTIPQAICLPEAHSTPSSSSRGGTTCHVFSDEMYRLLEYDPADTSPIGRRHSTSAGLRCPACPSRLPCRGCGSAGWPCGMRLCWRGCLACSRLHDHLQQRAEPRSSGSWRCGRRSRSSPATSAIIRRRNRDAMAQFCARHAYLFTWAAAAGRLDRLPAATRRTARGRVLPGCAGEAGTTMILPGDVFDHGGNHFRVGSRPHRNLPGGACPGWRITFE